MLQILSSLARVWQAEGIAALRDRMWDRERERRRRARFSHTTNIAAERWPQTPLINVIGTPIATSHGGVPLQLIARLRHESAHRPIALLSREPNGSFRLESWHEGRLRALTLGTRTPWMGDPLTEDPGWFDALQTCVQLLQARAVHIENAAALSLASLARLAHQAPALALSLHDFALFCRRPHLWESSGRFCDYSTDDARCHTCLSAPADQQAHRQLGAAILAAAKLVIAPSHFMRDKLPALLAPAINPDDIRVIAPGIDPPSSAARSPREPNRIAIITGAQDHKGGASLPALATALVARGVEVTTYGGYGHEHLLALRRLRGVRVRGYFSAGTLADLLAAQQASVAIAFSRVPESFSLTTSEAWAAGVPVVAPDLGAYRERLTNATGGGRLVSNDPSITEIADALDQLRHDRSITVPVPPTAAQSAEAHLDLYRKQRWVASA